MFKFFKFFCLFIVFYCNFTYANGNITLRIATETDKNDTVAQACVYFASKVKEYSKGTIEIKVYTNGRLGQAKDILSGVRGGLIELALLNTSYLGGLYPGFLALDLPYIFDNKEHAYIALSGALGENLNNGLDRSNLIGLAFLPGGFRNISTTNRPIRSAADMHNLKIRVPQTNALLLFFQALDARPVPLSYKKLEKALDKGEVEAQEQALSTFYNGNFYKYQHYISLTNHSFSSNALIINKRKFLKLSKRQKEILVKAAIETRDHVYKQCVKCELKFLKALKQEGLNIYEDVDLTEFKLVAKEIKDMFINDHGDNILRFIDQARDELESKKQAQK